MANYNHKLFFVEKFLYPFLFAWLRSTCTEVLTLLLTRNKVAAKYLWLQMNKVFSWFSRLLEILYRQLEYNLSWFNAATRTKSTLVVASNIYESNFFFRCDSPMRPNEKLPVDKQQESQFKNDETAQTLNGMWTMMELRNTYRFNKIRWTNEISTKIENDRKTNQLGTKLINRL